MSEQTGPVGMIWAQDTGGVIGADCAMLWRVPADFRHFRVATTGCAVVMGRTTWESIGGMLAGRRNIVLTHDDAWRADGAVRAASLIDALALAEDGLGAELGRDAREQAPLLPRTWVIGGGSVYAQAMDAGLADLLLVTTLDLAVDAPDSAVRAPAIDPAAWWIDPALSDEPGTWRERSGDARWRVDAWRRR